MMCCPCSGCQTTKTKTLDSLTHPFKELSLKCLILFATNVDVSRDRKLDNIGTEDETFLPVRTPYIDEITRDGGSGVLTVDQGICAEEGDAQEVACQSLAQLLGVLQEYRTDPSTTNSLPYFSEKYNGMQCGMMSSLPQAEVLGTRCKVKLEEMVDLYGLLKSPHMLALQTGHILGVTEDHKEQQSSDLCIIHVDSSDEGSIIGTDPMVWLDSFVRAFNQISNVEKKVMMVVIAGPKITNHEEWKPKIEDYNIARPQQSTEKRNESILDIDRDHHFICSRRAPDIIRIDDRVRFREVSINDAYSAIPIDRLIPEIAYKLRKSSKFGS